MELPAAKIPFEQTFDGLYGLQVTEATDELTRGHVVVREAVMQPMGQVHGGVYATIAETLASIGTHLGVVGEGKRAWGMTNQTSFLRPVSEGTLHAEARRRHRGRTTWIWDIEFTDDQGRTCALSRMTLAVRDRPA